IAQARIAIERFCCGVAPVVSPAKIGAQPGGSSTTNSVMKAERNTSSMAWLTGRDLFAERALPGRAVPVFRDYAAPAVRAGHDMPSQRAIPRGAAIDLVGRAGEQGGWGGGLRAASRRGGADHCRRLERLRQFVALVHYPLVLAPALALPH